MRGFDDARFVLAVVLLVALASATAGCIGEPDPGYDCGPLGNGGAMEVGQVADAVPNESVAIEVAREHLTDGENVSNRTVIDGTISSFHGEDVVHGQIAREDGVPEHYHVATRGRHPLLGVLVTTDGYLYRVVEGDC